ncbi:MAG TPA: DUF459 domain-containing protein [Kiritimatiellia bacterium]|nr:DUF459 domain-containing protein [Kiritimatiellia bacterium]HPS08164.1 DUF459 domain-containing protein [Kiritimatiellia bacterium]
MKKSVLFAAFAACLLVFVPPASRAAEGTPVLMIGDSMMRLLGIAMEKELKAAGVQPAASFSSLASGLARMDAFDWFAKVDALMKENKPATVVVTLGANDRQSLKDSAGRVVPFGTPEWEKEYALRVGRIMDELLKGGATRIVWLLLPDMREPVQQEYAQFVNAIFAKEAALEARKDKVVLFDVRPLLSRKPGTFSLYVMAANGAALTVRDTDGIHLTTPGAQRVAQSLVKTYWKQDGR